MSNSEFLEPTAAGENAEQIFENFLYPQERQTDDGGGAADGRTLEVRGGKSLVRYGKLTVSKVQYETKRSIKSRQCFSKDKLE